MPDSQTKHGVMQSQTLISEAEKTEASWYAPFGGSRKKKKTERTFDPERALPIVHSERPLRPSRNPPKMTFYHYFPFMRLFKPLLSWVRLRRVKDDDPLRTRYLGRKKPVPVVDSNVPLEITLFLTSYQAWLMQRGLLQPPTATAMTQGIAMLQDTFSNLERIRSTPSPFAYQAHLRVSLW